MSSVFSEIPHDQWIASNDLAFAIWDKFPESKGHALIIPKREVVSWFDCTKEEQAACMLLADLVKMHITYRWMPSGFRLMINVGSAQHVPHVHLHVIPHYAGPRPGQPACLDVK